MSIAIMVNGPGGPQLAGPLIADLIHAVIGARPPQPGPHYTNWSRPISRLVQTTGVQVSARIQHAVRKQREITGTFLTKGT
jgi:hypothetical protein